MKTKPKGKVCGAKLRGKDAYCQKPPMANGRCRLHGGKTPSGPESVHFKHGRYADAFKGKMAERFERMKTEQNPLDMVTDLQVQRTMLEEYLDQIGNRRKLKLNELINASSLAQDAVKSAAIIAQTHQKQALTLVEIRFFQQGMIKLLEKYVPNPDDRRNFIAELNALIPDPNGTDESEPAELPAGTG